MASEVKKPRRRELDLNQLAYKIVQETTEKPDSAAPKRKKGQRAVEPQRPPDASEQR